MEEEGKGEKQQQHNKKTFRWNGLVMVVVVWFRNFSEMEML